VICVRILNDDVGLNHETEGRRRMHVLSFLGRVLYGFYAVALTSDRSLSTLATIIIFIYTVRLVGCIAASEFYCLM